MPSVLQELVGEDVVLDHVHVVERVEDWKRRISSLYLEIISWLPSFKSDQRETVEMSEELMREYGVAPVQLPILRILNEHDQVAKFVPRGLWIIGANGRVDLFTNRGQFIIVDRAEYFLPPLWEIASSLKRREGKQLSQDNLLSTIE